MQIKGSFIQDWYYQNFDDRRWADECAAMKARGMDMLITSEQYDDPVQIRRILRAASANGIQICIGTGNYPEWWKLGSRNHLIAERYEQTVKKLEEVYSSLTEEEKSAVFGFYFSPEISSAYGIGYSPALAEAMNTVIDGIKRMNPDLPLLLSPYYSEYRAKSIAGCRADWVKILREVHFRPQDILCPQDAIGALWTRPEHLNDAMQMYLDAISESGRKIRFWVNCEDFISEHPGKIGMPKRTENRAFYPAPMRRFAWQMEQASHYTDTIITFAYNHYHSPMAVHPDYDRALKQVLETGTCADNAFVMSPGRVTRQEGKTVFAFEPVQSDWAVQCVRVYRLTKRGRRVFAGRCDRPMSPTAPLPGCAELLTARRGRYMALAEDVWGNESAPFFFEI